MKIITMLCLSICAISIFHLSQTAFNPELREGRCSCSQYTPLPELNKRKATQTMIAIFNLKRTASCHLPRGRAATQSRQPQTLRTQSNQAEQKRQPNLLSITGTKKALCNRENAVLYTMTEHGFFKTTRNLKPCKRS